MYTNFQHVVIKICCYKVKGILGISQKKKYIFTISVITYTGIEHKFVIICKIPVQRQISSYFNCKVILPELKSQISTALDFIDAIMLINLWEGLDYRWGICKVTKSCPIGNLSEM